MPTIRLILTDLDGTMVRQETDTATEAVLAAVREAEARGIVFAAVTGRPYRHTGELLRHIGFRHPCIFDGGAVIMNPVTGEILWSKSVPAATVRQAVAILLPYVSIIRYDSDVMHRDQVVLQAIEQPTDSIWANVPAEVADRLVTELAALPGIAVHANAGPGADFSRCGIQITHAEADKQHAVSALLRLTGIDRDHTMAIGDGDNDLPLFRAAAVKVAMGNASDSLKSAADLVVADVSHDGFAEAVRAYMPPSPVAS